MPGSMAELRAVPPNAWTPAIEQLAMRSFSFAEYEMMSCPLILLTVVATTDIDHVAAIQELSSQHHMPACFSSVS